MEDMKRKNLKLSGFDLKVAAVVLMLIDHAGAFLFPNLKILRIIGRLSFPIFAFLICEGYEHTRDPKKYAMRLLVFALISEPFFDFARSGSPIDIFGGQNVLFTFFISVVTISVCQSQGTWIWSMIGMVAADLLLTDYGAFGVLLVMLFWYQRKSKNEILTSLGCFAFGMCFFRFLNYFKADTVFTPMTWYYILNQMAAMLSCFALFLYNGKRGSDKIPKLLEKYSFYVIYPLQFLFFGLIKALI